MQIPTLLMWLCWAILFITIDGAKRNAGQVLISNGIRTTAAQVPWHAGIYGLRDGFYFQLCGGTLISAKVVVTAAHCFWDNKFSRKTNTTTGAYVVALGKYHRDWEVADDDTQRMDIAGIFLHKRFRGATRKNANDVAVVQLSKEARLTFTVKFALMDWNNTYDSIQLVEGSKGIVAGWGLTEDGTTSDVLMSVELPYVDSDVCYDMLSEEVKAFATHDKFCAGYTDRNTSVCPGDSGGGWVFRSTEKENGIWTTSNYFRGVVSVAFTPASHDTSKCYAQQVTGFSSLTDRGTLRWIKEFPIDIIFDLCDPNPCGPHSSCVVADGHIKCSCLPHHYGKPKFCSPQCDASEDCPAEQACVDGACQDICPGSCGRGALCSVVRHFPLCLCPKGYRGDAQKLCVDTKCGKRNEDPTLIAGGQTAADGEFPWSAAIFITQPGGKHRHVCSGTLVTQDVIITAAYCVYDNSHNQLMNRTTLRVVLGKMYQAWEDDLDDPQVQRLEVDDIIVHEGYRGKEDDYRSNIAILKLSTNATLTRDVHMACVDWANRDKLKNGSIGTIAGWGLTSNSTELSPTLQWVDLPWVDKNTCRNHTSEDMKHYITSDKFCAGYANQSQAVCAGDGGGGLMFREDASNRYFLRGVASASLAINLDPLRCHAEHYTTFTYVAYHIDWLKEHINL